MKRAVIVSNGSITDFDFTKSLIKNDDFIICADGAAHHLIKMGVCPDVWIGDYDSCTLTKEQFEHFSKESEIISLNPIKNATDTEEACNYAIQHGFDFVLMLGSIGTRIDHSLANIYLLKKLAAANVCAQIVNENNIVYIAKNENIIKRQNGFYYVSLMSLSDRLEDVSIEGMKYPLNHSDISQNSSLGVSNELIAECGRITIGNGTALIILSRD